MVKTRSQVPSKKKKAAPAKAGGGSGFSWNMEIGGGGEPVMKRADVLLFTGELADLLDAGMTLGQALSCLANQGEENSAQRRIAKDLAERIANGENFSDAVARHPKTFPPLYGNMLRAGEASGAMTEVLGRLVEHYERNDAMTSKIKGALAYPCIVLGFGVAAVVLMLTWIIPKFQKMFDAMGTKLPGPTLFLVGLSEFLISYGWLVAVGLVAAVALFLKWRKTPQGQLVTDGWLLKIPLVKGIVATGAYSSLAFTLKTLLTNGVNVLNALRILESTCGNAMIGQALATARKRVTDGTSISGPLAASGVFPRMMTDMLAVGEQAGNLTSSLEHIGKRYQKDMDRNISSLTNALGPILIGMIAVPVGFVIYAIVSAVFGVSNGLG
ncbi:MAG: type II secretion system F family protein [Kiritimatiellae bacterium]|nr:type II secretion system F family protein [Kiritimatiellia bacterium]